MAIFLITFFIFFTFIAYNNLPIAIAIIIALLPTYLIRFHVWMFPSTLLEGMILIIIGIWFLNRSRVILSDPPAGGESKPVRPVGGDLVGKPRDSSTTLRSGRNDKYKPFPFQAQIILIMITATISIFIAPDTWKALGLWRAYFLEPILFFLIFVQIVKTRKNLQKILYALGVGALGISLFAIYQKITGQFMPTPFLYPNTPQRVTSFYTSPNAVGLYLGPIIMIYLGWLFSEKKIISTLWKVLILVVSILAIIFTVSEGTWTGLIIALIFFAITYFIAKTKCSSTFCHSERIPRRREESKNLDYQINKPKPTNRSFDSPPAGGSLRMTVVIIVIITIFTAFYYSAPIKNKINQIVSTPSAQNRIILWQGSWDFLTENPKNFLFGAGIFGFPQIQEEFRDPLKLEPLIYPHNIFLNFWMEIGVFGMLAFIWLIINFIKKTKIDSVLTIGLLSAIITIIIHGLIDVPYFKNDLAMLFWVILGISVIYRDCRQTLR